MFTKVLERCEVWGLDCSIELVICHYIIHTNNYVIDTAIEKS